MTSEEATSQLIGALKAADVDYMLVGSLASSYYGVARATRDANFVIQLGEKRIASILEHLGPEFRLDPQLAFEMVTRTTRYVVDIVDIPFRIDLFCLSEDLHDQERFTRRRQVHLTQLQGDVFIPTVEDVIITKLRWASHTERGKDRDDVRHCIALQSETIDWRYVHAWCNRHETRELLEEILQSIPPI